eukprot:COSAG02_NODE_7946_length_2776_cov_1.643631_1_plen_43_part_10
MLGEPIWSKLVVVCVASSTMVQLVGIQVADVSCVCVRSGAVRP